MLWYFLPVLTLTRGLSRQGKKICFRLLLPTLLMQTAPAIAREMCPCQKGGAHLPPPYQSFWQSPGSGAGRQSLWPAFCRPSAAGPLVQEMASDPHQPATMVLRISWQPLMFRHCGPHRPAFIMALVSCHIGPDGPLQPRQCMHHFVPFKSALHGQIGRSGHLYVCVKDQCMRPASAARPTDAASALIFCIAGRLQSLWAACTENFRVRIFG